MLIIDVVNYLQQSVNGGDYGIYQQYAQTVNNRPATTLRDLLKLNIDPDKKINLDEVEPAGRAI